MGCLALLILAFIFRGAILSLIGGLVAVLAFLLSLGFWGIIIVIALCALAAALG